VTQLARVTYQAPEPYISGMVVEEVAVDRTPGAPEWPFQAARFEVPAGATTEPDVHDVAELWMVRDGRGRVRSGSTVFDVGPGEMVLFPGRVPHQVTNTGTTQMRLFTVWWKGATP
jgi:mannose-6-phosphate isomerase-like protein (cupin superfamily)